MTTPIGSALAEASIALGLSIGDRVGWVWVRKQESDQADRVTGVTEGDRMR